MQDLNRDFRGKNKPTDVLSFALLEGEAMPFAPPTEHIALGDIVIAVETADRQARERHHPLTTEIAFLAIHGALHLLGYDHGTAGQRRKMFALQDRLFEELLK